MHRARTWKKRPSENKKTLTNELKANVTKTDIPAHVKLTISFKSLVF